MIHSPQFTTHYVSFDGHNKIEKQSFLSKAYTRYIVKLCILYRGLFESAFY